MDTCVRQGDGDRRRRRGGAGRGSSGTRAAGFVVAATAYVADDLRKADGLTRLALRRAALSLADSRHALLRRAGSAYLRVDPPPADVVELGEAEGQKALEDGPPQLPPGDRDTPRQPAQEA